MSIDVEMSWGQIHRADRDYDFPDERAQMARLLDLFDDHDVAATWAFVGHLMLDGCDRDAGIAHPELVRPEYSWFEGDWLAADPCTSAEVAPTWYAPDLLDAVLARDVDHEIGSHSFTHLIAGDPGCSEDAFRSDLRRCRREFDRRGLVLRSFVFPRNEYGHVHLLGEEGFSSFRGRRTDSDAGASATGRRIRRVAEMLALTGRSAATPVAEHGLWNLPATYLHHVDAVRRYPLKLVQAKRRLRQAVTHRSLFHLWIHPHNVQRETERWFDGLEQLLTRASALRREGELDTVTMGQLAERLGPARTVATSVES